MRKSFALVLILILAVSSLMMVKPSFASITKPSVPGFTLKFVDSSYDVPTTYSIDPYTEANVTHPSYHVDNRTIEVTIKNQPFVSYYHANSFNISLYYNVRMKGHYAQNWTDLYFLEDEHPIQSNSDYTVISYSLGGAYSLIGELPAGAQVDFQVEAMEGYFSRIYNPNATDPLEMFPWGFTGEESGWSNTQTVTISTSGASPSPSSSPASTPTSSPSSMPSQNPTATQPGAQTTTLLGLDWTTIALIVLSIVVALLIVVIAFMRRRRVK
jgi:hypothetical protein